MSFPSDDVSATSKFFERYLGFSISMREARFAILKRPGLDVVIESARADAPTIRTVGAAKPGRPFSHNVADDPNRAIWPISFHIGLELEDVADGKRSQQAADYAACAVG
ncbi:MULTISPECIES: hypothetical protein [Sphingomonas]|uniref:hypothetical protein n=1 Tax=Sphingomonas TaxID=13687 RepID=UPI0012EE8D8C|nr:hypothetical protein [Sphingomonas pituitosa]